MQNRFNLIDEPWIPISGIGPVSLRRALSDPACGQIGGNPVERIAVLKLLLAIAQAAFTPSDDTEWKAMNAAELADRCLAYLDTWHSKFYLYGDFPFLQIPGIAIAAVQDLGALMPHIASGNTTVLSQIQVQRSLDDAQKSLLIVCQMAFALGGKKADNSAVLSPGYAGKSNEKGRPSTSRPGPAVAHLGLLHSFVVLDSVLRTVWLNLLTSKQIAESKLFPAGVGRPPWENMPVGEDCEVARHHKLTLQGRLTPLARFCLLATGGMHYSEGILHSGYKEGFVDPTVAVNNSGKEPKALWTDPGKRPWRELSSLLGFFEQGRGNGFQSLQVRIGVERARDVADAFCVWSGGLRVSSNAGEQYVSGDNDFVESVVILKGEYLGEIWFSTLRQEMEGLEDLAKSLYGKVMAYCRDMKLDGGKLAGGSTHLFWQLCERDFQRLVESCGSQGVDSTGRQELRQKFANYSRKSYDRYCPNETARQLDAWSRNRPNINAYLFQEK